MSQRYNPELQKRSLENRQGRQQDFDNFVNKLKEYSKSDKPSIYSLSCILYKIFPNQPYQYGRQLQKMKPGEGQILLKSRDGWRKRSRDEETRLKDTPLLQRSNDI